MEGAPHSESMPQENKNQPSESPKSDTKNLIVIEFQKNSTPIDYCENCPVPCNPHELAESNYLARGGEILERNSKGWPLEWRWMEDPETRKPICPIILRKPKERITAYLDNRGVYRGSIKPQQEW
jgi:hypothetical protein